MFTTFTQPFAFRSLQEAWPMAMFTPTFTTFTKTQSIVVGAVDNPLLLELAQAAFTRAIDWTALSFRSLDWESSSLLVSIRSRLVSWSMRLRSLALRESTWLFLILRSRSSAGVCSVGSGLGPYLIGSLICAAGQELSGKPALSIQPLSIQFL